MSYSIKQLAKIAKVSVRTLHYYDVVGLLTSNRNNKNQYRVYEETDLLKLQQILFFKELGFALKDIKIIIENPNFNIEAALNEHKKIILLKQRRLLGLIQTIDKTINKITNKKYMKDEELYDSFTKEEMNKLAHEAKERWGHTDAFKESEKKMRSMSKEQMDVIKIEGDNILRKAATLVDKDVHSNEVQNLIAEHYKHLSNFYTPTPEMYRGLAEMYIGDTRFKIHFEKYHPELPQFMHDAMIAFVDNK
ncbi:MAG: MerR family transcriptional regulator [Candidatus Pacebacteria bacterium]|nr:MerR family transcriptional regulator [Candidatus Paceibacterota bacterium]